MVTGAAKAVSKTCPDLRFSSLEVKMRSLKITVDIVWARDSPKINPHRDSPKINPHKNPHLRAVQ